MITACNACPDMQLLVESSQTIVDFRDSIIDDAFDLELRASIIETKARELHDIQPSELANVDQNLAFLSEKTRRQNKFQYDVVAYINDCMADIKKPECSASDVVCTRVKRIGETLGEVLVKIEVFNRK